MSDDVRTVTWLGAATDVTQLPGPLCAEIAFAGRSNVGKSSAINALVGRRAIVRTSGTPGCTRAIHLVQVQTQKGALLSLVDLPGYGYAVRSHAERRQWAQIIDRYLRQRAGLRAIVVVVDARHALQESDHQMLRYALALPHLQTMVLATKLDKLPAQRRSAALQAQRQALKTHHGELALLGFSAETRVGRDDLWQAIARFSALPAG